IVGLLDQLKRYSIPASCATYTRSLRAQALSVYNRAEDRAALSSEVRWLIASGVKGAYGYAEPPKGATQPDAMRWDNSNSQYGALGLWAAEDAVMVAPPAYWTDGQSHGETF